MKIYHRVLCAGGMLRVKLYCLFVALIRQHDDAASYHPWCVWQTPRGLEQEQEGGWRKVTQCLHLIPNRSQGYWRCKAPPPAAPQNPEPIYPTIPGPSPKALSRVRLRCRRRKKSTMTPISASVCRPPARRGAAAARPFARRRDHFDVPAAWIRREKGEEESGENERIKSEKSERRECLLPHGESRWVGEDNRAIMVRSQGVLV